MDAVAGGAGWLDPSLISSHRWGAGAAPPSKPPTRGLKAALVEELRRPAFGAPDPQGSVGRAGGEGGEGVGHPPPGDEVERGGGDTPPLPHQHAGFNLPMEPC